MSQFSELKNFMGFMIFAKKVIFFIENLNKLFAAFFLFFSNQDSPKNLERRLMQFAFCQKKTKNEASLRNVFLGP